MGEVTGDHTGSPLQGDNEIRTAKFQFCILHFAFCISVQRTDKLSPHQFSINKNFSEKNFHLNSEFRIPNSEFQRLLNSLDYALCISLPPLFVILPKFPPSQLSRPTNFSTIGITLLKNSLFYCTIEDNSSIFKPNDDKFFV